MKPFSMLLALAMLAVLPALSQADDPPVFLLKWGTPGDGPGQFITPQGMAVDPSGNVFVTDTGNNRVQKFTGEGVYVGEVGGTSSIGQGGFRSPTGIAIDAVGTVYVGDMLNSLIQVFRNDLTFVRQWSGTASGQLALDPTGQLLYEVFSEPFLSELQVFRTSDGTLLSRTPLTQGSFGIAVGASGAIYIGVGDFVEKRSASGTLLTQWGGTGTGDGQFRGVAGLGADAAENVYVGDGGNGRIQKFTSAGVFLTQWGTLGTGDAQFSHSIQSIDIDQNDNSFTLDAGIWRVQKFGQRATPTLQRTWGRLKLLYR